MKTSPLTAELFHVDSRTEKNDAKVAFRNCAKAPKMQLQMQESKW